MAHGERQIIELASSAEFAARAGRQEEERQEEYRKNVPETEQALVLAQLPEELPFQPEPSAITRTTASTIAKMLHGIKAATGIKDVLRIRQAVVATQALPPGWETM